MDYLIVVLIAGLAGWTEWRFRQLGRSQAGPLFQCYYCKEMFPVFRRERIGHYDYCPEHGKHRKAAWLADFKQEDISDNRTWVYPANSGLQQPDNDKFPWLS